MVGSCADSRSACCRGPLSRNRVYRTRVPWNRVPWNRVGGCPRRGSVASVGNPAASGFGSDWPVYHHDGLGSGVDPSGADLSSPQVAWTSPQLDGQLYGEPLVEGGRVIVATENDTVYALAANTGAVLWSTHIATPVPSRDLPCGDISPTVGITSTPVIDPAVGEIFVVADQLTGASNATHHLVGLNLFTGGVMLDQPVDPPGSHPLYQLQRPGLALDAGQVVIGFGGNDGDCETSADPYHGWLVAVPETGGTPRTFEVASYPGDSQGAIWMGGAAPIVDAAGNIWVATGNSAFESSGDAYDDSDGVLELNSSLVLKQYFAPSQWFDDNGSDFDLGSSSPSLMADGLVLQAGKSQIAYSMSQSSLGGVGGQLKSLGSYCGADVDGGSAISGQDVYTPCEAGLVKTQVTSAGAISVVWQTSTGIGGPPILAGGLVWTIDTSGNLYGLDPETGDDSQFFSLGSEATDFPTPSAADGLLLAPATDTVHAFEGPAGLPPPPPAPFARQPGAGTDISVGANGSVWVVGTNRVPDGYGVYRWDGTGWAGLPGGAVTIAVDPSGDPWVTNSAGQIYHWTGAAWILYPGTASDVAVGANGSVWVVGTNRVPDGYGVYRWDGTGWAGLPGGAVTIAVDPSGDPWVTNSAGQIYHRTGAAWIRYPGTASDVAVGASGWVWVVGTNPVPGGYGIYQWDGTGWARLLGGAVTIAVDPSGNPWVTNSADQIFSA